MPSSEPPARVVDARALRCKSQRRRQEQERPIDHAVTVTGYARRQLVPLRLAQKLTAMLVREASPIIRVHHMNRPSPLALTPSRRDIQR